MPAPLEIENQLVIDRPVYRSPEPMHLVYKPDPVCGCGCQQIATTGYSYDGERFASKDCVIRMMISEGWLKEVG